MDTLNIVKKKVVKLLNTYDGLLVETGGRCGTHAYIDIHLSIAQECINLTGSNNDVIVALDEARAEYSSYDNWKYRDLMLEHIVVIKKSVLAL